MFHSALTILGVLVLCSAAAIGIVLVGRVVVTFICDLIKGLTHDYR